MYVVSNPMKVWFRVYYYFIIIIINFLPKFVRWVDLAIIHKGLSQIWYRVKKDFYLFLEPCYIYFGDML
jgi:hypothetical protein